MRPYSSPGSKLFEVYRATDKNFYTDDKVNSLILNHDSSKILTATFDIQRYRTFSEEVAAFERHINFERISMREVTDLGMYLNSHNLEREYVEERACYQVGLFQELILMTRHHNDNSSFYPSTNRPSDDTSSPSRHLGSVDNLFYRHHKINTIFSREIELKVIPYLYKMPFIDGVHAASFQAPSMLPEFQNIAWDYFKTTPTFNYYRNKKRLLASTHYSHSQHRMLHELLSETKAISLSDDSSSIVVRNMLFRAIFTMLFWPYPKTVWDPETEQRRSTHTKFRVLTIKPKTFKKHIPAQYYFTPTNRFRIRTRQASEDFLLQLNTALPFFRFRFEDIDTVFGREAINPRLPSTDLFTLNLKSSGIPFHQEKDEDF